ncbi:MerR family transcriptional regulator [Streptosporangium sp. NPDC048047]|uniref:MerR family transcriptional regulator n=1 Tax=Streptosporangium sp. NPDC048047 TaxID=3155748 RepID=UPI003445EFEC
MELVPIGRVAEQLGLAASTLRYYDERGLVSPRARRGGRRMYSADELRRLAFLKIASSLGLPLDAAAAVLNAPGPQWRQAAEEQLAKLEQLIRQAQAAQTFLTSALGCPADHPVSECANMIEPLDRLIAGTTVDEIAAEHIRP